MNSRDTFISISQVAWGADVIVLRGLSRMAAGIITVRDNRLCLAGQTIIGIKYFKSNRHVHYKDSQAPYPVTDCYILDKSNILRKVTTFRLPFAKVVVRSVCEEYRGIPIVVNFHCIMDDVPTLIGVIDNHDDSTQFTFSRLPLHSGSVYKGCRVEHGIPTNPRYFERILKALRNPLPYGYEEK